MPAISKNVLLPLLLLVFLWDLPLPAEEGRKNAPTLLLWTPGEALDISADRMRFDYELSGIIFEENVRLKQSGLDLRCHKLTLVSSPGGSLERFSAEGALEIRREGLKISAMRADYEHSSRRLTLSGSPVVERASDLVRGERITIDFALGSVTVEKAQARVKLDANTAEKSDHE